MNEWAVCWTHLHMWQVLNMEPESYTHFIWKWSEYLKAIFENQQSTNIDNSFDYQMNVDCGCCKVFSNMTGTTSFSHNWCKVQKSRQTTHISPSFNWKCKERKHSVMLTIILWINYSDLHRFSFAGFYKFF